MNNGSLLLGYLQIQPKNVFDHLARLASTLNLGGDNATTVYRDGCTIHIRTRPATQEQASASHILGSSDPTQWNPRLDGFTESLEGFSHHLTLEGATGDSVRAK